MVAAATPAAQRSAALADAIHPVGGQHCAMGVPPNQSGGTQPCARLDEVGFMCASGGSRKQVSRWGGQTRRLRATSAPAGAECCTAPPLESPAPHSFVNPASHDDSHLAPCRCRLPAGTVRRHRLRPCGLGALGGFRTGFWLSCRRVDQASLLQGARLSSVRNRECRPREGTKPAGLATQGLLAAVQGRCGSAGRRGTRSGTHYRRRC